MRRYQMNLSVAFRVPFLVIGATESSSFVEVDDAGMRIKMGLFDRRLAWAEVVGVRRSTWPWYYGYGIRYAPGGIVAPIGSGRGVVEIELKEPQRIALFKAKKIATALADADNFVEDVRKLVEAQSA